MTERKFQQTAALLLILAGILIRVLPHPANFTPLTALALFSGTVLSPGLALTVPVAAMIASDLVLGPHPLFWLTWGCFLLTVLIGFWVRNRRSVLRIAAGTLAGSVLFFLLTNLGVFLFQDFYEKSWTGLAQCYAMALPFFRNSLLGDIFYTAVFFGVWHLAGNYSRKTSGEKA